MPGVRYWVPILIVLTVMAAMIVTLRVQVRRLENAMALRPPVITVDFLALAQNLPPGAGEAESEAVMRGLNDAIVALREEGYLILDAGYIVGGPDDLALPMESINPAEPVGME